MSRGTDRGPHGTLPDICSRANTPHRQDGFRKVKRVATHSSTCCDASRENLLPRSLQETLVVSTRRNQNVVAKLSRSRHRGSATLLALATSAISAKPV